MDAAQEWTQHRSGHRSLPQQERTAGVHHRNEDSDTAEIDETGNIETHQTSPTHVYTDNIHNTDDYKNLAHVMQYLRATKDLTLTIVPGYHLDWLVDSSYAVHPDMHSHSGICMTLGKGLTYSGSTKQKLNAKSSIEAELVDINYEMWQILCTCHFLATQRE